MNASKEIHKIYGDVDVWKRSFHDHVIRDKRDYYMIAEYIRFNPIKWKDDCFYSEE